MATTELTDTNFNDATTGKTVVIDSGPSGVVPCRSFAPVFTRVANDYDDVVFGKVDVDANPGLAQAFGVSAIPTLVVMRNGQGVALGGGSPQRVGTAVHDRQGDQRTQADDVQVLMVNALRSVRER